MRQYAEDRLQDPAILEFISRISAYEDIGPEAMGAPFRHAARLCVTTRSGRVIQQERLARHGSPEDAVDAAAIERKFNDNVHGLLSGEDAARLRDLIMDLDALSNVDEISCLLSSPASSQVPID